MIFFKSRKAPFDSFTTATLPGLNRIRLDASSKCQLKCPLCPNPRGYIRKSPIGSGYLKFSDFKLLVDENPDIKGIELSNYGEIFLNPELSSIMEYAYTRNISLYADNGVNLNTIDNETAEKLVQYQFRLLSVSVDGASNETYGIYRRGGNFDRVIENIEKINHFKDKYGSEWPHFHWAFIAFGHNEHELPLARELAKTLNMTFSIKLSWDPDYSPLKNEEAVVRELNINRGFENRLSSIREEQNMGFELCVQCWTEPQINWDGKLLGCCVNFWADFGNVFERGLVECLKSERYRYLKGVLLGREAATPDIPCYYCDIYQKRLLPIYSERPMFKIKQFKQKIESALKSVI